MKYILILVLLCPSCMRATKDGVTAFGGKGAYQGRDFSTVWDNEDSFRSGAALLGIAAGVYGGIRADSIAAGVTNTASNNATKIGLQQIKSTEAITKGAQAVDLGKAKLLAPTQ